MECNYHFITFSLHSEIMMTRTVSENTRKTVRDVKFKGVNLRVTALKLLLIRVSDEFEFM